MKKKLLMMILVISPFIIQSAATSSTSSRFVIIPQPGEFEMDVIKRVLGNDLGKISDFIDDVNFTSSSVLLWNALERELEEKLFKTLLRMQGVDSKKIEEMGTIVREFVHQQAMHVKKKQDFWLKYNLNPSIELTGHQFKLYEEETQPSYQYMAASIKRTSIIDPIVNDLYYKLYHQAAIEFKEKAGWIRPIRIPKD